MKDSKGNVAWNSSKFKINIEKWTLHENNSVSISVDVVKTQL